MDDKICVSERICDWDDERNIHNLETILKVCNQLAIDNLLVRKGFNSDKCKYRISGDEVIVYSKNDIYLRDSETSEIIADVLRSYSFECNVSGKNINIKFDRVNDDDFKYKVESSLSKVLER